MEFTVKWLLSHTALVRAWYVVVYALCTPMIRQISVSNRFLNSNPLSVRISPAPYLRNTLSNMARPTVTAVLSFSGTSTIYLVNTSMAVMMYVKPLIDTGKGPARSMPHRSSGLPITIGIKLPCLGGERPFLYSQQASHLPQKMSTSRRHLNQYALLPTWALVFKDPRCPATPSWMTLRKSLRRALGSMRQLDRGGGSYWKPLLEPLGEPLITSLKYSLNTIDLISQCIIILTITINFWWEFGQYGASSSFLWTRRVHYPKKGWASYFTPPFRESWLRHWYACLQLSFLTKKFLSIVYRCK